MPELDNVDWWCPEGTPLRMMTRFRELYEATRILERVREAYFWRPNFANREKLETRAKQMAELIADHTRPRKGRPRKRPLPPAAPK